jgi:hypothetical protein
VLYHWRAAAGSAAASQLSKRWTIQAGRRAVSDHLERIGADGTVSPAEAAGHYRVRYAVRGTPRVAALAAIADRVSEDEVTQWARRLKSETPYQPLRIAAVRGAAALSAAARAADADHLVLFDGLALPIRGDWLDVLLGLSQQPGVGAAGCMIQQMDGRIDSAGVVIAAGAPLNAFQGEPRWTRGHLGNILDARDCSAVGGCLVTTRELFNRVGGLNERAGDLQLADYCLRLRAAGLRVVMTPEAQLRRLHAPTPPASASVAWLNDQWGASTARDPYYNLNFDQRRATFRLPAALPEPSA